MPSIANNTQVGGTHYRSPIQHWDMVAANHLGYFEGKITGYVTRWRKKNGTQDLQKAGHFLEKLMELADQGVAFPSQSYKPLPGEAPFVIAPRMLPRVDMDTYAEANGLDQREALICFLMVHWDGRPERLREVRIHLRTLHDTAPPELCRG